MTAEAADDRQTQAIEKKIKENPALRDAWVQRQLQMELLEHDLPEAGDTTGTRTQQAPAALRA